MKLFKKLNRGQKLRRKSEVHKSIIGKKNRQKKIRINRSSRSNVKRAKRKLDI
jgi:hypothetical protein